MLKRISTSDLRPGMFIQELCGSWMEHPFWKNKFVLKDPEDIQRIHDSGIKELWIDTSKGLDIAGNHSDAANSESEVASDVDRFLAQAEIANQVPVARVGLEEEIQRAAKICSKAKGAVLSMFQQVRMGKAIDADAAGNLVEEISGSMMRNPGALISLARLKSVDDYTYMHSVAVCALMVALSRQLGQDDATTRELGMAGLVHDLGKAMMPMEVLNKPGKLTDEEFAIMKAHPVEGHRLLVESAAAVGEISLEVCLHHHEKMDGSGYPDRLNGEQISLFSKMGAICDVYDAITSDRPYKAGWDPAESVRKMAEWKGHFDEKIFQAFVRSIGIYPTGSLVRLESGRLGVVIEQAEKSLLTPLVKVIFSTKARTYIKPEILDLSRPGVMDRIVNREDPAQWGLQHIDRFLHGS